MKSRKSFVPKVSVVIPVCNVEAYLSKCLQSVVNQTLKDIEIICVNDGSTDGSLAILQSFARKDRRIRIIDKQNSGYGNSMNIGMASAKGEYIGIVESDDFIAKEMFEDLYKLSRRGTVDLIKGNFYDYYEEEDGTSRKVLNQERSMIPDSEEPFTLEQDAQISWGHPSVWSAIYRRQFLKERNITFLEVKGGGWVDNPFFYETLCRAESIIWTSKPYYYYRKTNPQSSSNHQTNPSLPLVRMMDNLDVVEKYGNHDLKLELCTDARALMYLNGSLEDFNYDRDQEIINTYAKKVMQRLNEETIEEHFNLHDQQQYYQFLSPLSSLQSRAPRILIYNWLPFDNPWHWGGGVTVYCANLVRELLRDTNAEIYFLSSGFAYKGSTTKTFVRRIGNPFGNRVHQYEIVNSPVPADQRVLYRNPLVALESETLIQVFSEFLSDYGPFETIHFNNIEGLSLDVFDLKRKFPQTKFIYSIHNYVAMCMNGSYYMRHKHCICHPGRTGEDCMACTRADIRSHLAEEVFERGKVGISEDEMISKNRWLKAFGLERLDQDVTADRIQDFAKTATAKINANCDAILAVSQRVYDIAAENGFDTSKMQVSYIGTKVADYQLGHAAAHSVGGNGFKLVFLGSDINFEEKGYAFLLDALEDLDEEYAKQMDLVLTVRSSEHAEMYRMLKHFRSVQIINGYTHDDLPQIFEGASLSIVPVLWEDNLPQIAIESVAYGVPVLASTAGGAKELCDSELFQFACADAEDLRNKLIYFLDHPEQLDLYWKHHHGLVTMQQHWQELSGIYGIQKKGNVELSYEDYHSLLREHEFLLRNFEDQEGLRCRIQELEQKEDIYAKYRFPFEMVASGARIVIYGDNDVAQVYVKQIARSAYCYVRGICTPHPKAALAEGVPVLSVAALSSLPASDYDTIIIAAEKSSAALCARDALLLAGLPSERIRWASPLIRDKEASKSCQGHHLEFEADARFHFPWKNVEKGARLVIYGGGIVGKTFLVEALDADYIDLVAVCDRNPEKTGIQSLPMVNLDGLSEMADDAYDMVLIANEKKDIAAQIQADLIARGIPKEKIQWCDPKLC